MVTRSTKGTGTRRRTTRPETRHAPTELAVVVRPPRVATMKARLGRAGEQVQLAGQAATKFARSSMREVTTAAKASREPMHALWRNVRLAGRHIARDAVELWQEVRPAGTAALKLPSVRRTRRASA
jgi:hypothetical protein